MSNANKGQVSFPTESGMVNSGMHSPYELNDEELHAVVGGTKLKEFWTNPDGTVYFTTDDGGWGYVDLLGDWHYELAQRLA